MRTDWSTKETSEWWLKQNERYEKAGVNQQSLEYLSKAQFKSVLEIGSGTGRLINKLSKGRRAGAVDINKHLLDNVSDGVKKYHLDVSEKGIEDCYELVYSFQCLQHLTHEEFLKALENIKLIATKEIWLLEGCVVGAEDGERTHWTGSYNHDYAKYLDCYKIDELDRGKIKAYRSKV